MRKFIILPSLTSLFLIVATLCYSQKNDETRILFVGNSFTYFYNLPQVVSAMAEEKGIYLITRQSTVGGSNLEQHWKRKNGTKTRDLIERMKWDYVIFNNHSASSIETPKAFMEYGKKLAELVETKGAIPVFMQTWAYKSNPLMQETITTMYNQLAEETGAYCVPTGQIFERVRKVRPDLELFFDDKHPSSNGTYLLGLAFYKFFTGDTVQDIPKRISTVDKDGEKLYLLFTLEKDAKFMKHLVDNFHMNTVDQNR